MNKSKKVVDVTLQVTVLEEDADIVMATLNDWFTNNETSMVNYQTSASKPKNISKWMIEALCPENM